MKTHISNNEENQSPPKIEKREKNDRRHTGTGVLIITSYFNEPYIILGEESWKSLNYTSISKHLKLPIYEEFGGGIQTKKVSLEKNATFELREETANLINIRDPTILSTVPYFDIPYLKDRMYRLYIVYINSISEYLKYFYMNINIIKTNRKKDDKSNHYLEMSNLKLIPLKVISNKINHPDNYICFKSDDNIHNTTSFNSGHLGTYKGILKLDEDTYLNSRLVEFLNSKYTGVTGLSHCYNYYKSATIKDLFPKINDNPKINRIRKHYRQNNEKYTFLNGTWSLDIFK